MRKRDRHPFKWGTEAWRAEFARLRAKGLHPKTVRSIIRCANWQAEQRPVKGERCLARTRRGTPCQRKALQNGRCPNHGGLSTGPKTPAGKAKALAAIGQKPRDQSWPVLHPPHVQAAIARREKEISLRTHARHGQRTAPVAANMGTHDALSEQIDHPPEGWE